MYPIISVKYGPCTLVTWIPYMHPPRFKEGGGVYNNLPRFYWQKQKKISGNRDWEREKHISSSLLCIKSFVFQNCVVQWLLIKYIQCKYVLVVKIVAT